MHFILLLHMGPIQFEIFVILKNTFHLNINLTKSRDGYKIRYHTLIPGSPFLQCGNNFRNNGLYITSSPSRLHIIDPMSARLGSSVTRTGGMTPSRRVRRVTGGAGRRGHRVTGWGVGRTRGASGATLSSVWAICRGRSPEYGQICIGYGACLNYGPPWRRSRTASFRDIQKWGGGEGTMGMAGRLDM